MPINFDALPTSNPFSLPEVGVYYGVIVEAEMRTPKTDPTKPDYLNCRIDLYDIKGDKKGTIFDILSESDSTIVQYKISRFVRACGIPLVGCIELKDLAKVVKGKKIAVDISHDTKSDPVRAQVDLFSREAYYLAAEFNDIYNIVHPDRNALEDSFVDTSDIPDENIPFNAPDGGAPGQAGY